MQQKREEMGWILAKQGHPSVLSLDFDLIHLEIVEEYIQHIQKKENLGTAVIIESSDLHYHVYFFWNQLRWNKIQDIIQSCEIADPKFKEFTKYNRFVRMRVTNLYKPFIKIVNNHKHNQYELGDFYFRHYMFLLGFAGETIEYYIGET